ncbi:hypothetical protein ACP70R_044067 [Stipagrostis hirtigluma subsp. patula]
MLFQQWGFEKLVFRNSITGVRRDRKYAIQAKNAYATGVHMSENVIGNTTHKTEHLIRYYQSTTTTTPSTFSVRFVVSLCRCHPRVV